MAEERHTAAFVVGAILGGLGGAAATLWKTPKSGAQLRAELAAAAESLLFRLTEVGERGREKLDEVLPAMHSSAPPPAPAAEPSSFSSSLVVPAGEPPEPAAGERTETGPAVFPPLVDFAPPGVDLDPPPSSRQTPPA